MALQDMPNLPPEYIPRMEKFVDKIKSGEVTIRDIMSRIMGPMMSIMMPIAMRVGSPQIAALTPKMISMIPSLMGKRVFLKVKNVGCFIGEIGLPPKLFKLVPSSLDEIKAAGIPGIVLDPKIIAYMTQGMDGLFRGISSGLINIYGFNELMSMFQDTSGKSVMIDVIPTMLSLMTSEVLMSMQEPVQAAVDDLLTTYGV